jgi:DNA ligase-1
MLAQKWDMKLDPAGWWMSEKLDGVRGYWDGKNFYSRLGNQFPAPDWFKEGLPSTPLDGELWCGRRQFRRCLSIVRNRSSGKLWEYITFLVFDAPSMRAPYEERVAFIKSSVKTDACRYAAPVGIVKCSGREHLSRELKLVDSKGGEGIMLRQAGSAYENKRSNVLRKVKSVHDEEAKIVGHEGGRGRAGFHCGALTLETPDGRRFSCGSGLSAADRHTPPALGTMVTYRFTELMDNGYPRFPVYVGPRLDLDWASYCANYSAPAAADHRPGELKRKHSILYADAAVESRLVARAESLPAASAEEPVASEGSEGGDTEADNAASSAKRKPGKRKGEPSAGHSRRDVAAKAAAAAEARARCGRLWRGASIMQGGASSSAAAAKPSRSFKRSRTEAFAESSGLDLATARSLLHEHDSCVQDEV